MKETIKNMIRDLGDKAVDIDCMERRTTGLNAGDKVITYVKPALILDEETTKAFGLAWVYKRFRKRAARDYYEDEVLAYEESPSPLCRYWDDGNWWALWETDPGGCVEDWKECAGEDEARDEAVDATMEEYEEQVKEHKEYEAEQYYDGYEEDMEDRIFADAEADGGWTDCSWRYFEDEVEHKEWWEEKREKRNWLLDVVENKWFDKIDRMTDKMCEKIYNDNINIEPCGMKKGNLYKNSDTKALGIVCRIRDKDSWKKGKVRLLVEGEMKEIGLMKNMFWKNSRHECNDDWVKVG